mmetsp:Transcript_103948/g.300667  ORF Transcript_103948/g.300667 Transcript_103948/m.300667 type:complete len:305 (+) Transcript_103948:1462-2376(+)
MHSRPHTKPIAQMVPPLCTPPPYISHAAKAESSKMSLSGSMILRMRSRTKYFPRLLCNFVAFSLPPCLTTESLRCNSSHSFALCSRRLAKVGSEAFALLRNTGVAQIWSSGAPCEYHEFVTASASAAPLPENCRRTVCGNCSSASCTTAVPLDSNLMRTCPLVTCLFCSTRTSNTLAGRSVVMSLSIFIADSTTRTSPAATSSPTLTLTSATCPANGASKAKTAPGPSSTAEGCLCGAMCNFRSSTHVVCTPPLANSSCVRMRWRKSLLTNTPATTKPSTAALAAAKASGKSLPRTMSLAIMGS